MKPLLNLYELSLAKVLHVRIARIVAVGVMRQIHFLADFAVQSHQLVKGGVGIVSDLVKDAIRGADKVDYLRRGRGDCDRR